MTNSQLLVGIFCLIKITLQVSSPESIDYVGAVVEYFPYHINHNDTAIIDENTKNYCKFIETASKNDVDIIVFPESSLMPINFGVRNLIYSSYIPNPKDNKVPCNDTSSNVIEAVKDLSCAAKQHGIYVVINLHEKEKCIGKNKCPSDGHMIYNTNVVFNRNGTVIARYRKWNLFGEVKTDKTLKPELSYFNTDFNVTFGQFICFDILFKTPALTLLEENNITDIVYSTYWFSELPYLTSNAIQNAYSYGNDVNLLSSGLNSPITGSGGSGIYAGKNGIINNIWSEKRINSMIIAKIPKIINGRRVKLINPNDTKIIVYSPADIPTINGTEPVPEMILKSDDIEPYTTRLLKPINGTENTKFCHDNYCCNYKIQMEYREDLITDSALYYRYRLAVFNGVRSFGVGGTGGIEVCSIISCIDDTLSSCNKRFDINTKIIYPIKFNSIVISGDFKISSNITRYPLSLTATMNELNSTDVKFITKKINTTHDNIQYKLTKSRNDLMTFAIYGRNFTADGLPKSLSRTEYVFSLLQEEFNKIKTKYQMYTWIDSNIDRCQ